MIDKSRIENAIKEILLSIGEDVGREGLAETPKRVACMYEEILGGMGKNPEDYVKTFCEPALEGEVITVENIPVYSVCEHHMLPFVGVAKISYIPREGMIVGLSKFSRIVDCFARRLQVQERLTAQIADFIQEKISPIGVTVEIEAEHLCMTMRGVKSMGSKTRTVVRRGEI